MSDSGCGRQYYIVLPVGDGELVLLHGSGLFCPTLLAMSIYNTRGTCNVTPVGGQAQG